RAIFQVWKQKRSDSAVILDQITLGVALVGPEDFFQIRKLDLFRRTVFDRGGSWKVGKSQGYWFVFSAIFWFFVRSQSQERRMANPTVIGPVREAHLANKPGLHPVVAAAGGTFFYEG